jgi:serine/threonine protein phosphatase PrpC
LIESYAISHVGCVRRHNEDRVLADESLGLFIVADGMGGHKHGEVAADLAISTVRQYIEKSREPAEVTWPFGYCFDLSLEANRLSTGMRLANRRVWRLAEQAPEYIGMGTTIAAVLLVDDRAVIGNVGDSRVYLFRGGELTQLTTDDTWIASFLGTDLLAPDAARNHPMRNVLTQAAGSQETIDVHIREQSLLKGDTFLISSDGLHGIVEDQTMGYALATETGLSRMAAALLREAQQKNAPDNVSVVLLRYDRQI